MNNERHVKDLLPAYALGCLDPEELAAVRKHLERCASCRAGLAKYEEVVGALGLAAPPAEPPAALKKRILAGIEPVSPTLEARSSRSIADRVRGFWSIPRVAPAWAAAAILAMAVLAVSNILLWQRLQHLETLAGRLPSQVAALSGSESAPEARGVILYRSAESRATLVVENLPPLSPDRQYQLWLIRDGGRTSGGVFSVSPRGYGTLEVSAPLPLGNYQAFGITVEPAGGSPGPTGPRVLGGEL
jgi:anti-sigma-K factor RskA